MTKTRPQYRVISSYDSPYPASIMFAAGEHVSVGPEYTENTDWVGWVRCVGEDKQEAWIPQTYLKINGKSGRLLQDYDARELSIRVGEVLAGSICVGGFILVENSSGEQGWVPEKCLERI